MFCDCDYNIFEFGGGYGSTFSNLGGGGALSNGTMWDPHTPLKLLAASLNASFLEGKINVRNKITSLYAKVVSFQILVFLERFEIFLLDIVFHRILVWF